MPNFITHRQKPNKCPKCFSNNVVSHKRKHYCLDCEFEWSSEDELFAKGVQPDRNFGILELIRRLF